MRRRLLIPILICILLGQAQMVFGYDDEVSHPGLTDKAVLESTLTTYFSQNMGADFVRNHESVIGGKTMIEWIKHGSKIEDDQVNFIPCRNSNHFHNPLIPDWTQAGLTEVYDILCSNWLMQDGTRAYSALVWATSLQAPDGTKQIFNEPYSPNAWDSARKHYESALTNADRTIRETSFAETFKALGQTLHLIQDMAVPAHTRNDFNKSHLNQNENKNPYERYVSEHPELVNSTAFVAPNFTNIRLTDFWDSNQTPDVMSDPSLQDKAGLSEYTNANFLSEGTLFLNRNNPFVYPSEAGAVKVDCIIANPLMMTENSIDCTPTTEPAPIGKVKRTYWRKTANWETGHLLTGENYLDIYYTDPISRPDITIAALDDYVHSDYAQKLLPRAVGYSAALLDYFFRGAINMVSDLNNPGKYVIKNLSNENMAGTFSLYYDDIYDNRIPLDNWELTVIANGQSAPIVFTKPEDPAPKRRGTYILVFQGTFGSESGAVAGRIVKDVIRGLGSLTVNSSEMGEEWQGAGELVSQACGCLAPGQSWPDLTSMDPSSFWTMMIASGGDRDWYAFYESTDEEGTPFVLEMNDVTYNMKVKTVSVYDEPSGFNPSIYGCDDMGFYCDVSLYGIFGGQNHSLHAALRLDDATSLSTVEFIGKQSGVHIALSERSVGTDPAGTSFALYRTPMMLHLPLDPCAPSGYGVMMNLDSRMYPLIPNEGIIVRIDGVDYDTSDPTIGNFLQIRRQNY